MDLKSYTNKKFIKFDEFRFFRLATVRLNWRFVKIYFILFKIIYYLYCFDILILKINFKK